MLMGRIESLGEEDAVSDNGGRCFKPEYHIAYVWGLFTHGFSFRNARLEDEMAVGKNREAERRECRNQ